MGTKLPLNGLPYQGMPKIRIFLKISQKNTNFSKNILIFFFNFDTVKLLAEVFNEFRPGKDPFWDLKEAVRG